MDKIAKRSEKQPRAMRRTADTTFDRVYKYYFDTKKTQKLTYSEAKQKVRWEHAWMLMGDMLTTTEVVRTMMKKFKISERAAYMDVDAAKRLFGDPAEQVDKARKAIFSDFLMKSMRKAMQAEEWHAVERFALRYARLHGLDVREDDELAKLIKDMKPHTIVISGNTKSLQEEADDLMQGVPETEDAEYEDVSDED